MDTDGIIQEHGKLKLELYRLYLERYLSVLQVAAWFDCITVYDIFAGRGIDKNGEKGSAVIAHETIEKTKSLGGKSVYLELNDASAENFKDLKKHLTTSNITISNQDANEYLKKWCPRDRCHNLVFIDPHGYTQVDTANLQKLFVSKASDFLIFIPISHIYRFLKPSEKKEEIEANTHGDLFGYVPTPTKPSKAKINAHAGKYFEPIEKFLAGLGIDELATQDATSPEEFAHIIVTALRKISGAEYVYVQILENKVGRNKYGLFFVTKHILGAEKFLEAQSQLQTVVGQAAVQLFDFIAAPKSSILDYIADGVVYDNVSLYELSIRTGIWPDIKKELQALEKSGRVIIEPLPGQIRNRGGIYLSYQHYKKAERKISINFVGRYNGTVVD